ncbi:protein Flattop isoform X2 [Plutella xylostella]|uniref:protein Flattop isoform X2 n=1 Tax=Plutella xylostella TaxID=51655 RepID=UPI002032D51A|nr:protein Flattop isoform X2 [Plutella xylostella]
MAFLFDSGQYNKETTPKRLGNWEVPRWAPTRPRPAQYRPEPRPICDDNGHFLAGPPSNTSKCFGHYVGTWDLPRKITRKVAEELAKEPPPGRFRDWLNVPEEAYQQSRAGTAAAAAAAAAATRVRGAKRDRGQAKEKRKREKSDSNEVEDDESAQTFQRLACPIHSSFPD